MRAVVGGRRADRLGVAAAVARGGGELGDLGDRILERPGRRALARGRVPDQGPERRRRGDRLERAPESAQRRSHGVGALRDLGRDLVDEGLERGDGVVALLDGAGRPRPLRERGVEAEQLVHVGVHARLGEHPEIVRADPHGREEEDVGGVGRTLADEGVEGARQRRRERAPERRGALGAQATEHQARRLRAARPRARASLVLISRVGGLCVDDVQERPELPLVQGDVGRALGRRRRLARQQPAHQRLVEVVDGRARRGVVAALATEQDQVREHARLEEVGVEIAQQPRRRAPGHAPLRSLLIADLERHERAHAVGGDRQRLLRAEQRLARAALGEGEQRRADGRVELVAAARAEVAEDAAPERLEAVVALRAGEAVGERPRARLGGPRAEVADVAPELDHRLGDRHRRGRRDRIEQRLGRLGLGVGRAREPPHHRRRDPGIPPQERSREELPRAREAGLGLGGDARAQRRRAAPPFGRRELGREEAVDLGAHLGRGAVEQPARDRDVPPHQSLAIGEQRAPCGRDRVRRRRRAEPAAGARIVGAGRPEERGRAAAEHAAEGAERLVVALRGAAGGLARGPLEEAPGEAALRQRRRRGRADPVARQLAARSERERQRIDGHVRDRRERERQGDARPDAGAREAARRSHGHARGDRHEGGRVALVELDEHAPAQRLALGPEGERACDLVERDRRGARREPGEVLEQAVGEGGPDALGERLGVDPVERPGAVDGGEAERGDALPEHAATDAPVPDRVELEQALEEEGPRPHPDRRIVDPRRRPGQELGNDARPALGPSPRGLRR